MSGFDLRSLREVFADQGVMICFNGPFSHSVIEELGTAVKKYLESADAPTSRVGDVFAVFVEQAQNLKNYTAGEALPAVTAERYRNGILVIAKENERYIVSSGNMVKRADVETIKQSLDRLSKMDKAALKAAYKERLRAAPSDGKGAGLGLIDMARRAAEPLRYSISEQGGDYLFFSISAVI